VPRVLIRFEREKPKVLKTGALGSGEANGSAAMAAATLAISANLTRAGTYPYQTASSHDRLHMGGWGRPLLTDADLRGPVL
jgi:hypothetical protein